MKNKAKLIYILSFIGIILFPSFFILAQEDQQTQAEKDVVDQYSQEINQKENYIDQLSQEINELQDKISAKRSEIVNLNNQLAILSNQVKKIELDIELNETRIEQLELEIKRLNELIKRAEKKITENQIQLAQFIQLIWRNSQKSYLEILLVNDSFSDFFDELNQAKQLQENVQKTVGQLRQRREELENNKEDVEIAQADLSANNELLTQLEVDLTERLGLQQNVLTTTRQSESEFQKEVARLRLEQQQINAEIATLERRVREELQRREAVERFKTFGPAKFIWPVPSRYITAKFHDPDYPFRHIFEHPAIDIRAGQGTPIKAAESGYVARAKDAGLGYSFIMIIHNDGFSTVYGHVSKIFVTEDQFVTQGDIIGLSGGTPGTPGAGNLVTGPHLHFEVRKDGIPVNPAQYLP
ncbi:MAG: hypothetical protein COT81_00520 [Candidatus Buchananbacteria bacterium CG10_big_fil_rev_8_21_14_0_10_42_9]|uniref:M23ase beta-sheet core domain-containing protein n=1 Tax=Candidatus Buchananbacteria bacterium CG10_big_fil_rev_8_21_14_0_10_42_9 TaxID=1974526 RepID=A0A2H0W285_9BACT|nr:MAG: hypothetical protein COT81_00520 [Candidatus Buchananbacteria bacterium CG10_big_fil_rev_8_21_14_0_10_42_9]